MLLDPRLIEIKTQIDRGVSLAAKAMLLPYLKENPNSADAWWLMSLLTDQDGDRGLALQKALSIDPTHYEASVDYAAFQERLPKSAPEVAPQKPTSPPAPVAAPSTVASVSIRPLPAAPATPAKSVAPSKKPTPEQSSKGKTSSLMEDTIQAYVKKGWTITSAKNQDAVLEKSTGISWGWAIASLVIPLAGVVIFFANFFMRRHYRIHLTLIKQGHEIEIRGKDFRSVLNSGNLRIGGVPMPKFPSGMNALMGGAFISIILCCIAPFGLATWAGSQVDPTPTPIAPRFSVGQNVFLDSPEGEVCVDLYDEMESITSLGQLPVGWLLNVQSSVQVGQDFWYQVRSNRPQLVGWVAEDYLSNLPPGMGTTSC
jgi:hypothetical protein